MHLRILMNHSGLLRLLSLALYVDQSVCHALFVNILQLYTFNPLLINGLIQLTGLYLVKNE